MHCLKYDSPLSLFPAPSPQYSEFAFCAIIGECKMDCCDTPYTPTQIHIATTGDPTEMVIMYAGAHAVFVVHPALTRTHEPQAWWHPIKALVIHWLIPPSLHPPTPPLHTPPGAPTPGGPFWSRRRTRSCSTA